MVTRITLALGVEYRRICLARGFKLSRLLRLISVLVFVSFDAVGELFRAVLAGKRDNLFNEFAFAV